MRSTIDIASWLMNATLVVCVFVSGSIIIEHELVSPRDEVAKAVKLNEDGSLPALSEQQLVSGDWRAE